MDRGRKLLELLGVTSVKDYVEPTTFEQLMEIGGYYGDLFQNAFSQGEIHSERVECEIARLLAEALQPEARRRHGIADEAGVRRLAAETFETSATEEWTRLMAILTEGITQEGLSPDQQAQILEFMEGFRDTFIDQICREAAKLKMIPIENVNELSLALAEMLKEDDHVNEIAGN